MHNLRASTLASQAICSVSSEPLPKRVARVFAVVHYLKLRIKRDSAFRGGNVVAPSTVSVLRSRSPVRPFTCPVAFYTHPAVRISSRHEKPMRKCKRNAK